MLAWSQCSTLALLATLAPTRIEILGGPGCPTSCPTVCAITTQSPIYSGSTCVDVMATWTRLQNGCAENPSCTPCRQCLGRLRVDMTATASCVQSGGGGVKVDWRTETRDTSSSAWTITGSGTGALAQRPDGSYAFTDTRDVQSGCGKEGQYYGTATTQNGSVEDVTAMFTCDACSSS